jgi:hypothetical protein
LWTIVVTELGGGAIFEEKKTGKDWKKSIHFISENILLRALVLETDFVMTGLSIGAHTVVGVSICQTEERVSRFPQFEIF